jgi:hypothetical protein
MGTPIVLSQHAYERRGEGLKWAGFAVPGDAGRRVSCPIPPSKPPLGDSWITLGLAAKASDGVFVSMCTIGASLSPGHPESTSSAGCSRGVRLGHFARLAHLRELAEMMPCAVPHWSPSALFPIMMAASYRMPGLLPQSAESGTSTWRGENRHLANTLRPPLGQHRLAFARSSWTR